MDTKNKIAIIVPAINLWDGYTKPCIDSLLTALKNVPNDFKLYLIDNESNDGTSLGFAEYEARLPGKFERLINPRAKGCAASWNVGMRKAIQDGCEFFFIVNNDTLFHPLCLGALLLRYKLGQDADMITAINARGECPNPEDIANISFIGREECPESEHPDFSAFMLTKKCYETVGEFDEGFAPAYFEDNDYHYRIKLAGLKAICLPAALYYHFGSKTQNEAIGRPIVSGGMFENNHAYFVTKWGGGPDSEACRFINPFNDQSKSIKWTKQMEENTNANVDGANENVGADAQAPENQAEGTEQVQDAIDPVTGDDDQVGQGPEETVDSVS